MLVLYLYVGLFELGLATGDSDSVFQNSPLLSLIVGQTGTIGCNFTTAHISPDLFWYRQLQNQPPHKLLHVAKYRTSDQLVQGGFSAAFYWDQRLVSLNVSRPEPEDDGAVFYCALSTGVYEKLIFGSGTKLKIKPNIPDSSPSVYRLKPAGGSKAQVGPACLVTDFSPADNVTVLLNDMVRKRPATLVQSETQWSYGIVEWSSKPNDKQFECKAQYKEKSYNIQNDTNVLKEACSGTPVNESFKTVTDEKLNTLSLTVLALKIIFLKSIVFNLLMTVCLWIC